MTLNAPETKKKAKPVEKFLLIFIACLLVAILVCGGLYIRSCTAESPTTTHTGGGTLKLSGTDPTTLDPALSSDANSANYIMQIYSGLVKLDENLEPAPDIAERWDISDDGCTFAFYLRDNAVFQDGRKVTAADVKYSWERACNPATGSITAATYLGDIVGAKEMVAGQTDEITGIHVVNDNTLQVTIDAPISYFLSKLSYPTAMVVDRNNVAVGANWWRNPNGSGPFKLKEYQQSTLLVLERNDDYYGEVASLEFVEFHMYSGDEMSLYETGQIDVAAVYADYIDRITDPSGPFHSEYHVSPQLSFSWLGFDTNKPPFDDLNVRKAFSMAIDKDKIINLSLRNLVERADGILPPGMPGFNENLDGLSYNAAEARALITSSKYGSVENLPPIVLTLSGYGVAIPSLLEAVIVQWRENLGVEVTVRLLEPDFYIYHLKQEKDNMFYMGWIADYPHPQDFLDVLFHTGGEYNYGEYSNPSFDALVEQAGIERDNTKSLQMYQGAEQMLVDDAALIPLYFGQNLILVKPYVQGYVPNALGYVMLNKVKISAH
jgi:oligopeptide transport system substrate-binding protein